MRVTVLLFARLRELAGRSEWHCSLPTGATVADAWQALAEAHPDVTPLRGSVSAAVNTDFAPMSQELHERDEVAFLPPVSGGAW
jgi:molybdopterin converting factor subunit 1